jgi:hypothetical protein
MGSLLVYSSVSTPGLLQPRAVLTHINDNSVGEHLGNGVPTDKYGTALELYPFTGSGCPTVQRLDIRHASIGIKAYIPPCSLTVWNCIFRNCTIGIWAYYIYVYTMQLFMCDVPTPFHDHGQSHFPSPDYLDDCTPNAKSKVTVHPGSLARTVGSTATFNVTAGGYGVTYQWYFNGASIAGATSPSYTISSVQHAHAGQYWVVVANDFGSDRSQLTTLTVSGPPLIVTQPAARVAYLGGTVTFSVAAIGNTPFSYQWRKNGVNIAGATSHEYTLNNIQSGDFANYSVSVGNAHGSSLSATAALTSKSVGSHWVYTSNTDFQKGYLINLNHNVSGELRINADPTPLPYLNVPCSARDTLARVDVNSGAIVGEYRTAPAGLYHADPSRVAVDRHGNVWVGNRYDGDLWDPTTVTRVGVVIGGVRGNRSGIPPNHSFQPDPQGEYLKPPFIYNTCFDRDGDGLIRTSRAIGHVLDWPAGSGVSSAEDEAILHYILAESLQVRMVAVDAHNDAWVGGTCDRVHAKFSGITGGIIPGSRLPVSGEGQGGGYGGLVDGYGVVWSAGRSFPGCSANLGLIRYDPAFSNLTVLSNIYGDYGLAIDPQTQQIWYGSWDRSHVAKYDRWGNFIQVYGHGNVHAHGMVVDNRNRVWVSHNKMINQGDHTGITVGQLRTDGTFVGNVALARDPVFFQLGPTGLAVDRNQKVWVANSTGNSVMRIHPDAGPFSGSSDQYRIGEVDLVVDLSSAGQYPAADPYAMGDMTGFIALGATRWSGCWVLVQDGGGLDKPWHKVSWNPVSQPTGTGLTVEVRAANTIAGLPWNASTGAPRPFVSVGNNVTFNNVTGRYLEVRVTLSRNPEVANNPRLADLTVHWPQ